MRKKKIDPVKEVKEAKVQCMAKIFVESDRTTIAAFARQWGLDTEEFFKQICHERDHENRRLHER